MQGAQNLFTEDQDGIEKTQASHKITKPFLSKEIGVTKIINAH